MWCAIILAGGGSTRMGAGRNKVLLPIGGVPAIVRSVSAFSKLVDKLIVVSRPEDMRAIRIALNSAGLTVMIVPGGDTRQASVWNGLCALPDGCDRVLIHDGARCLIDEGTIRRVIDSVRKFGTGVAAIPVVDTIKQVDANSCVTNTLDRSILRAMQTPQGFNVTLIRRAHIKAQKENYLGTDDAALVERLGVSVHLTLGNRLNIKLTTPEDLIFSDNLYSSNSSSYTYAMNLPHTTKNLILSQQTIHQKKPWHLPDKTKIQNKKSTYKSSRRYILGKKLFLPLSYRKK